MLAACASALAAWRWWCGGEGRAPGQRAGPASGPGWSGTGAVGRGRSPGGRSPRRTGGGATKLAPKGRLQRASLGNAGVAECMKFWGGGDTKQPQIQSRLRGVQVQQKVIAQFSQLWNIVALKERKLLPKNIVSQQNSGGFLSKKIY